LCQTTQTTVHACAISQVLSTPEFKRFIFVDTGAGHQSFIAALFALFSSLVAPKVCLPFSFSITKTSKVSLISSSSILRILEAFLLLLLVQNLFELARSLAPGETQDDHATSMSVGLMILEFLQLLLQSKFESS
jgi:hypothetical protein